MGGGTFFKMVGTSARQKKHRKFLWFELVSVTSQALEYDISTYNYTTVKTYRLTTWNSNELLQGRPRLTASLGLIIRFILT